MRKRGKRAGVGCQTVALVSLGYIFPWIITSTALSPYEIILQTIETFNIKHHSELPEIYNNLAILYAMRRQLKEAIEYTTLAVDIASRIPLRLPINFHIYQENLKSLCTKL